MDTVDTVDTMMEIDDPSDLSSDEEIDLDMDPIIQEIETLHHSIETSLTMLTRLQDQFKNEIKTEIKYGDRSLDQILDELHSEALKEIESTGQSSFGANIIALFS